MKHLFIYCLFFIFSTSFSLINAAEVELKLVDTYEHDKIFARYFFDAVVDQDENLIIGFGAPGCSIVTPKEIKILAPLGKGPNDLSGYFALNIMDNQELYVEGMIGRMHVFKKKDGKYSFDRTEWRQLKKPMPPTDCVFWDKKWFSAVTTTKRDKKTQQFSVHYLQVFSSDGKFIKNMIHKIYEKAWNVHLMDCHLVPQKQALFFLAENSLSLKIISGDNPKVTKTVALEPPKFYKPMPESNYIFPQTGFQVTSQEYKKFMALWKTNYSRVTNVLLEGQWLIIQARTADEDNKLFGLLFYDADTFELKHTIMTDDLLLAGKNGKLYFFRGGNPAWDDVEDTVFDIYNIVEKK